MSDWRQINGSYDFPDNEAPARGMRVPGGMSGMSIRDPLPQPFQEALLKRSLQSVIVMAGALAVVTPGCRGWAFEAAHQHMSAALRALTGDKPADMNEAADEAAERCGP